MPIGGAQVFVVELARGLLERGHTVTLLAANGSVVQGVETPRLGIDASRLTPARFEENAERTDLVEQTEAFGRVRAWLDEAGDQIDVVHGHAFDAPSFTQLTGARQPVCHTLHLPPLDPGVIAAARDAALARVRPARLVTVSEANAAGWRTAGVPVLDVVPNGIDLEAVPFGEVVLGVRAGGYLLFAGRIAPEKGPDRAILAARELGLPLVLAGGVYDATFAEREVLSQAQMMPDWQPGQPLGLGATFVGPQPRADLFRLMAGAAALLLPVRWAEPFGLVAIEAQAAGCPVVAYDRGGLPEVILDGQTGFVVPPDDVAGFVVATQRALTLDRRACRGWVAERFSLATMAASYERVYEAAVVGRGGVRDG